MMVSFFSDLFIMLMAKLIINHKQVPSVQSSTARRRLRRCARVPSAVSSLVVSLTTSRKAISSRLWRRLERGGICKGLIVLLL